MFGLNQSWFGSMENNGDAADPGDNPPTPVGRRQVAPSPPPSSLQASVPSSFSTKTNATEARKSTSQQQQMLKEDEQDDHTALTAQPSYDTLSSYDPYDEEVGEDSGSPPVPAQQTSQAHCGRPSSPRQSFHSLPTIDEAGTYATSIFYDKRHSTARVSSSEAEEPSTPLDGGSFHNDLGQERYRHQPSKHVLRRQLLHLTVKLCLGILLIMMTIMIVIFIVHRSDNSNKRIPESDRGSLKFAKLEDALNFLLETRVSTEKDILNPRSPQYKAIRWMMMEDPAKRPLPEDLLGDDAVRFVQRYALATFYFSTGGPTTWENQLNFLSADHECAWYTDEDEPGFIADMFAVGVTCNTDMLVSNVFIPNNGLTGSLPPELFELREMSLLALPHNSLEQTFDESMNTMMRPMTQLQYVDLKYNRFSGPVPPAFGEWLDLHTLALSNNMFSGPLPSSISRLAKLKTLALDDNQLTGSLEMVTDHLTNLEYFYGDRNQFFHLVDDNFAKDLNRLRELDLSDNELYSSSSLPLPAHLLNHPSLQILDLANNDLRGTLPSSMQINQVLEFLSLRGNELHGAISAFSLPRLERLKHLDIQGNRFYGALPTIMHSMKELKYLAIGNNEFQFNSGLPDWLWVLTGLQELSVPNLDIGGEIPSGLAGMTNLIALDLSDNNMSGDVPAEVWDLPDLAYLLLHRNSLDGRALPSSTIMGADRLRVVSLFGNENLNGSLELLCNQATDLTFLAADCAIECPCCAKCCSTEGCFEDELKQNADYREGLWEYGYKRTDFAFDPALLNDSS